MNAYELADKLEKSKAWLDSLNTQYKNGFGKYCLLPNEVAVMLRQQADRIAELNAKVNFYAPKDDEGDFKKLSRKELLDYIEYLRQCVDTPQTKPLEDDGDLPTIAWMDGFHEGKKSKFKTLSDDEIIELAEKCFESESEISCTYDYEIRLVRAIEERILGK